MSQYDYDAIIVGAGHNGLIVAATLAKAGQSVLLLKNRPTLAARRRRELFPGCHFNVGAQEAGLLRQEIVHALGLTDHGLTFMESPATHFAPQPDGRVNNLARSGPKQSLNSAILSGGCGALLQIFVAYLQQMSERLEPILRQRPSLDDMGRLFVEEPELVRLATIPLSEFLDNWFEGNALKGILGGLGVSGMMRGPYAQGGVFMLLYQAAQGNGGLGGGRFVQGGMGQLAQALATAARAHGAEMRTNAAVASILLEEERAIGVRLDNGQEVSAAAVFSSLDARHTFSPSWRQFAAQLCAAGAQPQISGCTAQVHLALRGLPDFRGATDKTQLSGHIVLAPGLAYLERAYDAAKYGDFSPNPYLDIVIPSLLDPTLAPTGQQVMSITMQYAPYDLRGKCWDDLAEPLGDAVLAALEQIAPGVGALVNQRRVMTPLDWEREWGLTEGNIYQGEMSMEQMFAMRPTPSGEHEGSPIKSSFSVAAAHPGGGLTGLPGWTTGQLFTQNEHA